MVANGNITAIGSGMATITATTSNGKTATCTVTVNAAVPEITQVEGATIDGTDIFMLVDHMTDSVALSNKVTVSSGRWDLYSDIRGQNRIPTKIAAGSNGRLQNGNNIFYITLENENGDLEEVYTLTVYRSYAVAVNYYNHKNMLVYSDTAYTGYEYALNYDYTTPGYTFNNWTENGVAYQPRVLWNKVSLYANMTANTYTVELDTAGGILDESTQTVTYDKSYSFPVPARTGYTFLGWYSGDILLADTDDETSSLWQYTDIASATAKWQVNQYYIAVRYENGGVVEGSGAGTYNYGTEISLTAPSPNLGYAFLGWYLEDKLLTKAIVYNFDIPARNMVLTVKYEPLNEMSVFNFTSTPTTCTITGIKDKTVTCIVVPNYVTSIGKGAFSGCDNLTDITLPFVGAQKDGTENTYFGYIFGTNSSFIPSSLRTVIITQEVQINDSAFEDCSGLTSVVIPDNVTIIGKSAFEDCSSLMNITIPDSVISIGNFAFSGCTNLTSITIPDGVRTIGHATFSGCNSLTGIAIPDSVTKILHNAFYGCSSLTNIMIPNGVTSIEGYTFYKCSKLTSVTIPNTVMYIGMYAFAECSELTNITIPDNVTYIDLYAFSECRKLMNITIPSSVTDISTYVFSGCSGLTNVVISNGVTSIGACAFLGCSSLASITIPNSVESIGVYAFVDCIGLTEVHITDIAAWCGISFKSETSNPLFYAHNLYLNGELVTNLVIPDNVLIIGDYTFLGCSCLTRLTMHSINIGDYAFYNCRGLISVIISNSVRSIGEFAFKGCESMISVIFEEPNGWDYDSIRISSDDLSDPAIAAQYLQENNGRWTRI